MSNTQYIDKETWNLNVQKEKRMNVKKKSTIRLIYKI